MLLRFVSNIQNLPFICCLYAVICTAYSESQLPENKTKSNNTLWPPVQLGAPTQPIRGEHISLRFYGAIESTDKSKNNLQATLHNFLENLQKNLTTSTILNTVVNIIDVTKTQHQLRKVHDLFAYFRAASETAETFAEEAENLFEITKNESNALLLKLRQVPTAHRQLPMHVKSQLTDYFAEMEFFHIMLCGIIDQALEFIVDTIRSVQRTFSNYSDIQKDLLYNWNFKRDEWCCNRYMDFLQDWSVQIFECTAGAKLSIAYDVYAMTEVTTLYILHQLEFRIQRLFNCFLIGSYELRCRFLKEPEIDFEKLHAKLEELQIYYDIKIKHGRVSSLRHRKRKNEFENKMDFEEEDTNTTKERCIPDGFPNIHMVASLKSCFYFPKMNE